MGDPAVMREPNSVKLKVHLPVGEWVLGARPVEGYGSSRIAWITRIMGHASTVIIVLLLYWLYSSYFTIRQLALHDSLTGLANRRLLYEHMAVSQKTMSRTGKGFTILYIDLDGFKQVNDLYGHKAGDTVLKEVTERITKNIRPWDIPARVGGDEFVILLKDMDDPENIEKKARILEEVIKEPVLISGNNQVAIGASIGMSRFPQNGNDPENLILMADRDMYRVKLAHKELAGNNP
jgi:diguanylate cyclase (GGDEF)-like protein